MRGPVSPDGAPEFRAARVQRYRYSLPAIAQALFLWALDMLSAPQVRAKTSPLPTPPLNPLARWPSLLRWARCWQRLFGVADSAFADQLTHRQSAKRIAALVLATGPRGDSDIERIFFAAQEI